MDPLIIIRLCIVFGTIGVLVVLSVLSTSPSSPISSFDDDVFNLEFLHERVYIKSIDTYVWMRRLRQRRRPSHNSEGHPHTCSATRDMLSNPCWRVEGGDSLRINVVNNLNGDYNIMRQKPYPSFINNIINNIPNHQQQNLPGNTYAFGYVNLHLHGMQVTPHLFDPPGTVDPNSDWISIRPGSSYNYEFVIPKTHPSGSFLIHPHLHGNVMLQMFNGAFGLIQVGEFVPSTVKCEVMKQRLCLWTFNKAKNANRSADFIDSTDETTSFGKLLKQASFIRMVNDVSAPLHITFLSHKPILLEFVGGLAISSVVVSIHCEGCNYPIGFVVVEQDGQQYSSMFERHRTHLIVNSGTRIKILFATTAGVYHVESRTIRPGLEYNKSIHVIARLNITQTTTLEGCFATNRKNSYDGQQETTVTTAPPINNNSTIIRRSIIFDVDLHNKTLPFPQFIINDRLFNIKASKNYKPPIISDQPGIENWEIINKLGIHVYHQHVCPARILSIHALSWEHIRDTFFSGDGYVMSEYKRGLMEQNIRDTLLIFTGVSITIVQDFSCCHDIDCSGKTLVHCHLLNHEDTGMIFPFIIQ